MRVAEVEQNELAAEVHVGAMSAGLIDQVERAANGFAPFEQSFDQRGRRGTGGVTCPRGHERADKQA